MVRSSKVSNQPFGSVALVQSNNTVTQVDSSYLIGAAAPKIHYTLGTTLKNRVEMSGMILPFIFLDYWDVNCKVFLYSNGDETRLFRNMSSSLFLTSNGYFNVAGGTGPSINGGGGFVIGTFGTLFNLPIELVFSQSANYSYFTEKDGEGDTTADLEFQRKSIDLQAGMILRITKGVDMALGITSSTLFSETITGEHADLVNFNPITVQVGGVFYLDKKPPTPRRRRHCCLW